MPSLKSLLDAFARRAAHGAMPDNYSQSGQAYVVYNVTTDSSGFAKIVAPFDCCAGAELQLLTVSSDKKWLSFGNPSLYGGMGGTSYFPSSIMRGVFCWSVAPKGQLFHIYAEAGASITVYVWPKYLS